MNLKKILIGASVAAATLMGCTNKFEEMNQNPWTSNDLDVKHLFTFSQLKMYASGHEGWRGNLIMSGPYAQNTANLYSTAGGFGTSDGFTSPTWDLIFGDIIKNITDVMTRLENEENSAPKIAQMRIVRVVNLLRATQMYGDIPYFEAGKGYTELNYYPQLDPQKDILVDMAKELNEARDIILADKDTYIFTYDLYSSGIAGAAKYAKLCNSLLMKIGLMMSEGDATEGARIFKEGFNGTGGYIETWNDAVYVAHVSEGGPWGQHINGTGIAIEGQVGGASYAYMSELALQQMQAKKDPRLFRITHHLTYEGGVIAAMGDTTQYTNFNPFLSSGGEGTFVNASYRGVRLGDRGDGNRGIYYNQSQGKVIQSAYWLGQNDNYPDFKGKGEFATMAAVSPATFNRLSPSIVIGADEIQFMLAEASLRGYGVGNAETAYKNAVELALTKYDAIPFPGKDVETKYEELYKRQNDASYSHDAAMTTYVNNAVSAYQGAASTDDKLDVVAYENWVALIGNGYESFANWNRTHLPSIVKYQLAQSDKTYQLPAFANDPILNPGEAQNGSENTELHSFGVTNGIRPSRFPYPNRELTVSPTNTEAAIQRQRSAVNVGVSTNFIAVKQWYSAK
ncbi:SusD/RagB family nutrient-binding outer membrane lipoprotein [Flammeovirga pectinis]|uniref:SusD/RagB family nutrient-binding outer membrane lipoprotein n=1 Tax=Flammeovirga pectinis TaxID=2494373 RepID=A0A3S9P0A4_9BACT|nr:SusD/RagB family nutrient-binding outer membrane lipoprotein [Flammeovirga pectinis]AZQ61614.1 SusD/RagB family nutrient-binding outer membrane lipoprotein [Flammeovirga pectinis]